MTDIEELWEKARDIVCNIASKSGGYYGEWQQFCIQIEVFRYLLTKNRKTGESGHGGD